MKSLFLDSEEQATFEERELQVKEFINSFCQEFQVKFGITPSVYYSFQKSRYKITLEQLIDVANDVLRHDPEYVEGHTIQTKSRMRYLVLYRQCVFRLGFEAGYGSTIIGLSCNHSHATVIHGARIFQELLETKDKQTISILKCIEYELEKRYGFEGNVQPDNGPGAKPEPVLHVMRYTRRD